MSVLFKKRPLLRSKKMLLGAAAVMITVSIVLLFIFLGDRASAISDREEYILLRMGECFSMEKDEEQPGCFASLAPDFLDRFPFKATLESMGKFERDDVVFLEKCHTVTHYLGIEMYKRTGSVAETLSQATPDCIGGAYHGAIEGFFIAKKDHSLLQNKNELRKMVKEACGGRDDFESMWAYGNCYHGLGHALMFFTENELPDALNLCDAVTGDMERTVCYDGAFMENADAISGLHPSQYILEDDVYYPCTILEERYRVECYSYALAHRFQGDMKESVAVCDGVPEEYRVECFFQVGNHIPMSTIDKEVIVSTCQGIGSASYEKACIRGSVMSYTVRFGEDGAGICDLVKGEHKEACGRSFAGAIDSISSR